MALKVEIDLVDVNGEEATMSNWVTNDADSILYVGAVYAATVAAIKEVRVSAPVPLQALTSNTATMANVETCRTKMHIKMRGADLGSLAEPFAYANVGIPAPIGTVINGKSGDVTQTDVVALAATVLSDNGVQMSTVESIYYGRGR